MSHYSEQFLKQNPLAVLGVLRDLQKGEVPLRISWSNNQSPCGMKILGEKEGIGSKELIPSFLWYLTFAEEEFG